jgi:hypothetical protein
VAVVILLALGIVAWMAAMFWAFGAWSAVVLLVPVMATVGACAYVLLAVKIGDYGE